jgi:hypothetical protein
MLWCTSKVISDVDTPPRLTPAELLSRLRALVDTHALPVPGGEALHHKLTRSDAAPGAWSRLAHAVHADWIKGRTDPPGAALDAFIDAVQVAWRGRTEAERLTSNLYPSLIRALGARRRGAELAALIPHLAPLADSPEAESAITVLLRQLRQQQLVEPMQALLQALRPVWQPGRAWGPPLLTAALALARDADTFEALRVASEWLEPLLTQAEAEDTDSSTWRELGKLAQRCLDVPSMQRVCAALLAPGAPSPDTQAVLIQLLSLLAQFAADTRTRELLDRAARWEPRHPAFALGRARIAHAQGATLNELAALIDPIDPALPGYDTALSWWAGTLFHGGDDAKSLSVYQQLAERDALSPADHLRLAHLTVREGAAPLAQEPIGASVDPAWSPQALGALAEALAPLMRLLAEPPVHDAALSAQAMADAGRSACEHLCRQLPLAPGLTMQACLQTARQLAQLEAGTFASHTQWLNAFPFELGPAYGRVDARRCRALGQAVLAHVAALCNFALERPRALASAPAQASLRQSLDLAELRLDARHALAEGPAGQAELHLLQARLGTMGREPLRELEAHSRLMLGELQAVRGWVAAEAVVSGVPHEVLPMHRWADWLAAEGLSPLKLVSDTRCEGRFESVTPTGEVRVHSHRLAKTSLSVVHCAGLRVRHSHLAIGARGGILLPEPWHLSMGDYPYEHPQVRLRGAAGAVLRASPRPQRVNAPVLVLGNMDATYHRNYYHWMLLILARIDRLRSKGLLKDGRRLLVPRELSGWMRSSLADIGLADDQMLLYGQDDELHLSDALLASPIEFASPTLAEGLRHTLWRRAGLDPLSPPPADRLLYISRRDEGRRPLVEEVKIQAIAESLGFEVVAPETLSLLDQVRLFAQARGIAGPPGAAYTNLIWSHIGTRVLSIFKEEANLPTFIDLSIIRGQQHRWLLGRNLPGYALMSIVNAPFSVDLGLAERELRWVAGAR